MLRRLKDVILVTDAIRLSDVDQATAGWLSVLERPWALAIALVLVVVGLILMSKNPSDEHQPTEKTEKNPPPTRTSSSSTHLEIKAPGGFRVKWDRVTTGK